MREEVFKEYYKMMVSIINYKEKDKDGNIRKCTVPVNEANKDLEKYKVFTCTHPNLQNKQFAYDIELVKKQEDKLRELCGMLPQERVGWSDHIWLRDLVNTKEPKEVLKQVILAETFFAMCEECKIMRFFGPSSLNAPNAIRGTLAEPIPTTYKKQPSHDEK